MRILSFSSCFPSGAVATDGIFVFERLSAVARKADVRVVHPIAVCPLIGPVRGRSLPAPRERIGNLTVRHCRYRYLPGLLKRFDGYFYYRGLYRWVERLCLGDAFDLLDAHFVWPDGVGVSLIARRLKLPYVVTLRGTINPRYGKACFGKRIREALRNAAAVISVSKPMAEIAIKLGVEPAAVRVIPNGVDAETFRPLDKAECRRRLGMDSSTPLVVCVAGLKRPKGQEDLIRAMQTIGGACLVLIGPPAGRPGYLTYLKALASRSGLDGRVLFAGRVDRATVVDYLNAADVSVLPSHGEGCPNVLLESLACGTPVVATSVGGVPDLLRAGCAGLLVPPREPAALASAIRQALATRWPRAAIRKAVAGRTWQIVADEVLEVFRLAVGR